MTVKINLHRTHRQYTNGLETVEVKGKTVGECLDNLVLKYPPLEKEIFDKKRNLSSIMEIYLNGKSAYPDELNRKVKDGDTINLIYFLAGG